jgi:hypothetical protein
VRSLPAEMAVCAVAEELRATGVWPGASGPHVGGAAAAGAAQAADARQAAATSHALQIPCLSLARVIVPPLSTTETAAQGSGKTRTPG